MLNMEPPSGIRRSREAALVASSLSLRCPGAEGAGNATACNRMWLAVPLTKNESPPTIITPGDLNH
jgi:hypothetical protein